MRLAALLTALALIASACHEAPTSIFSRPVGPPPSGLAVSLRISPSTATPVPAPTVVAEGDSLIASAKYEVSGCFDYAPSAGFDDATLVITITESSPSPPRYCALVKQTAVFRTVVRPAPRGVYVVALRQRIDWMTDGPVERERARGTVSIP
jgi:hypothetical protein